MANLKKLKRDLAKLNEDELKDVISFMIDDEEETKVEETKEEKVEVKEEPKKEVKEEVKETKTITLNSSDLEALLKEITSNFVTKEEVKEVKEEVNKVSKKAKPFGVETKVEKTETKEEVNIMDYLNKVNSQFV